MIAPLIHFEFDPPAMPPGMMKCPNCREAHVPAPETAWGITLYEIPYCAACTKATMIRSINVRASAMGYYLS